MLALYLMCVICALVVTGHPDGAPLDSCDTMTPVHGTYVPQTTASPFSISVTSTNMIPNAVIQVTLGSTDDTPFQGFLLKVVNKNATLGVSGTSFYKVGTPNYQFLACDNVTQSAITHVDPSNKTSAVVAWTANSLGTYYFVASVAEAYETFWVNLLSEDIHVYIPTA